MATVSTHLSPALGTRRGPTISPAVTSWRRRLLHRPRLERLERRDAFASPSESAVRPLGLPDVHR